MTEGRARLIPLILKPFLTLCAPGAPRGAVLQRCRRWDGGHRACPAAIRLETTALRTFYSDQCHVPGPCYGPSCVVRWPGKHQCTQSQEALGTEDASNPGPYSSAFMGSPKHTAPCRLTAPHFIPHSLPYSTCWGLLLTTASSHTLCESTVGENEERKTKRTQPGPKCSRKGSLTRAMPQAALQRAFFKA